MMENLLYLVRVNTAGVDHVYCCESPYLSGRAEGTPA